MVDPAKISTLKVLGSVLWLACCGCFFIPVNRGIGADAVQGDLDNTLSN